MGGSSVVYQAYRLNDHGIRQLCLVKECNPWNTVCQRDPSTNLLIPEGPESNLARYAQYLERFQMGLALQQRIRSYVATNSTADPLDTSVPGVYAITCFEGTVYSRIKETDLFSLLETMEALTREVGRYHSAGYLHLDIKPDNFLVMPETRQQIILFDFDSVSKKDELAQRPLSFTASWAAPEQRFPAKRGEICEATDLYAIGRIIFQQIMGRPPEIVECRSFSDYSFEGVEMVDACEDQERVKALFTDFFHKTLVSVPQMRYSTAAQLLQAIRHIKELVDPAQCSLASTLPRMSDSLFLGREEELLVLSRLLHSSHTAWISGMGGIGKSTLAIQYGIRHRGEYDKVIFARYNGSWMNLINSDNQVKLLNWSTSNCLSPEDLFERKMNRLEMICQTFKILFIIDNFETTVISPEDEQRHQRIRALENCDFIYTTRLSASGLSDYEVTDFLSLSGISCTDDAIKLFQYYCKEAEIQGHEASVQKIVQFVRGHPLTLELLAKQMREEWLQYPDELFQRLDSGGLSESGAASVAYQKDGKLQSGQTSFHHICALFHLSSLDLEQRRILSLMTLAPLEGIEIKWARNWFSISDIGIVNALIKTGWLDRSGQKLEIHPVIREVALNQTPILNQWFVPFLRQSVRSLQQEQFFKTVSGHVFYTQVLIQADRAIRKNPNIPVKDRLSFYTIAGKSAVPLFQSTAFLEQGKVLAERNPSLIPPERLESHLEILAENYLVMHRYREAEALMEQCEDICRTNDLFQDQSTAALQLLRGTLYLERQELPEAESAIFSAFALARKTNGNPTPTHRLAAKFYMTTGDLVKAEAHGLSALEIQEKSGCFSAREHGLLGKIYKEQGDLDQAETHYVKALEEDRATFGPESHNVACDLRELGKLYQKRQQYREAIACFREDLKITVKIYGRNHLFTAFALEGIASYYKTVGPYWKYSLCQKHAMQIKASHTENQQVSQASAWLTMAKQLFHAGDYKKALSYCNQALSFYQNRNQVITARILNEKGAILEKLHKLSDALTCFEESLRLSKAIWGDDIYQYASTWFNSGQVYLQMQKYEEAEARSLQAIAVLEKRPSGPVPVPPGYYMGMGKIYSAKGQLDSAQKYYQKALDCATGSNQASALQNMGALSRKKGRFAEAETYFKQAMKLYQEDDDQVGLATSYASMGHTKKALGELSSALSWYTKSYRIRERRFGVDDFDTQRMRTEIQDCCKSLGIDPRDYLENPSK